MRHKPAPTIIVLLFFCIAAGLGYLALKYSHVYAAGKATALSVNSIAISTPTETSFSYTSTSEYAVNDVVRITVDPGVTLANCAVPTTDADNDTVTDGSSGISGSTYTYTFTTAATTQAATASASFCITVSAASAGNYAVSFTDSKANPADNDYGVSLVYIGDANDVVVTATVPPMLAFVIRDSTDTTNTNACNLGTLSVTAVNTCNYLLKVSTNANTGYSVSVVSDGDLRSSGSGDVADALDIDRVADGSGSIVAGTENYGIALSGNQTSANPSAITEGSSVGFTYNTDDSPVPFSSETPQPLYTSSTRNDPTTTSHSALVTHRATMDASTNTGIYSHTVTYFVIVNF